jgi:hypothetical protein
VIGHHGKLMHSHLSRAHLGAKNFNEKFRHAVGLKD